MHRTEKERIDVLLVNQGFFISREKAKAAIMAGLVFADEERIEKAGFKVNEDASIKVKGTVHPFVSRGGLKLQKAIEFFQLDLQDKVMLDIGSSTGGFTDCALQHGARYVYAIDVGTNQLDWKIRQDERVKVMEQTNFRYLTPDALRGPSPNFAAIDVSFISLTMIFTSLKQFLSDGDEVVALIKPQFEAGRNQVGKSGVIRDSNIHNEVVRNVLAFARELGFLCSGLTYSPVTGAKGNIEFLAMFVCRSTMPENVELESVSEKISIVVEQAAALFHS